MSFLADVISRLVEWFVAKFIVEKAKEIETKVEIEKEAQTDADNLKKALSPEETAKVLSDIERHTFHD